MRGGERSGCAGALQAPVDLSAIAGALLALRPLWLVLCVAVPVAIRLGDGGPVLYSH